MIRDRNFIFLYKLLWIFTLVLYIVMPFKNEGIQRICYYSFYVLNFALFLVAAANTFKLRNSKHNIVNLILIFAIMVSIGISMIMTSVKMTFSVHGSAILGFLCTIVSVYYISYIPLEKKMLNFIFAINVCFFFVCVIFSRSSFAYDGRIEDSLYLGYSNPNATAIYLFLCIIYLLILWNYLNKIKHKIILLCLIAYMVYLVYCTDSRTSMAVTIVVLIYGIGLINIKVNKVWIVMALAFPIAFLLVYSWLFENRLFLDLEIMGKEFYSGREAYFIDELRALKNSFWFGDIGRNHLTNMHNGFLSLIASTGLIGTILYYIFILHNLFYNLKVGCTNKTAMTAMLAILAVYIQTSSEAALMTGGANYTIPIATLYMISRMKN